MKISIKTQIIISVCSLVILLMGAQIIFNLYYSKQYFIYQNKNDLVEFYNNIQSSYSDDTEILYELTMEEDLINGFSVQIFSDTQVIYSSRTVGGANSGMAPPGSTIYLNTSGFSSNPQANLISQDGVGEEYIVLQGKFEYEGETRYVLLSKTVESIDASVEMFTKTSIYISLGVLLVGCFVIMFMAKKISTPVKNMEEVSTRLSNLEFDFRANENTGLIELNNLAKSMNSMSLQLDQTLTDLEQANNQLLKDIEYQKKVEELRKQLIANISHEMKTPLFLLQLYCDNLKNNVNTTSKEEYCDIVIQESQRLDGIVQDMLKISTIENELMQYDKKTFDLSNSTQQVLTTLKPILDDFITHLEIDEDIMVSGDQKQIEEAMRNYIMNAITHTSKGNIIEIHLNKREDEVCFFVYNEGNQIEPKDIEQIWDSFYKSDESRTRKISTNAGLGLYIVRIIINNHNGTYHVENIKKGVKFSFHLPLVKKR